MSFSFRFFHSAFFAASLGEFGGVTEAHSKALALEDRQRRAA